MYTSLFLSSECEPESFTIPRPSQQMALLNLKKKVFVFCSFSNSLKVGVRLVKCLHLARFIIGKPFLDFKAVPFAKM